MLLFLLLLLLEVLNRKHTPKLYHYDYWYYCILLFFFLLFLLEVLNQKHTAELYLVMFWWCVVGDSVLVTRVVIKVTNIYLFVHMLVKTNKDDQWSGYFKIIKKTKSNKMVKGIKMVNMMIMIVHLSSSGKGRSSFLRGVDPGE